MIVMIIANGYCYDSYDHIANRIAIVMIVMIIANYIAIVIIALD